MTAIAEGLVGHWPLAGDTRDHAGSGLQTRADDVELGAPGPNGLTAARFNGRSSRLEVADHPALHFGTDDLAVAAMIETDGVSGDVVGDLISKFDPASRRGVQLSVVTNSGVTSTAQANYRNLHFGIDEARLDPAWTDCGRPGNAAFVMALAVCDGLLYAGTFELGDDERGHLWRYDGGQRWVDLGNPVGCNAISSVVAFDGALYCGTGRYKPEGSVLGEARNTTPGGQVYQIATDGRWIYRGHPGAEGATPEERPVPGYHTGKADEIVALTVYHGELYCGSYHRRGMFKYVGGEEWVGVGLEDAYPLSLTIYRGQLYALVEGGPVFRYEGGSVWSHCGRPERSQQTYAGVTVGGELYVGTWPEGEVFRYQGERAWQRIGRVGYEREVMGMAIYNGKAYLGTLPMANVWRMDGDEFAFLGTLDQTAAELRRAWSLAVYNGRLFCGTLPSGHIHAIEAGKMATWDQTFPAGWHHVAAVREGGRLKLYVDGRMVSWSGVFHPGDYDLTTDQPLMIGAGAYEHFSGLMRDVRLYRRALSEQEIGQLSDHDFQRGK